MKHDYTNDEIRDAWKDSLSLRAFLDALPERPQAQAKPSTRIEITEIPDKQPGHVGTLVYAPQAEALPSTQQNKSESSALEKQAVQEAAYILNHYDRKSHADHICLGKKLIREGWKGPNFGKQKSDLKLTLHRSAAEDTPQAEAKAISTEPEDKRLPPLNEADPVGHCAVEAACVHRILDELEIPREEGGDELSLWGRVVEYAKAQQEPAQPCVCGSPTTIGTVHRSDGPCYQEPAQPWTPAVGDVVRLKSGGPVMTVYGSAKDKSFICCVHNTKGLCDYTTLPAACLIPAQP